MKIRDISLSRIEPFGTRDTATEFGTVPKNSGWLATLDGIPIGNGTGVSNGHGAQVLLPAWALPP